MIGEGSDALDHALQLRDDPGVLPLLRARPLPDGVLLLIRIAAGDKEAMRSAQVRSSAPADALSSCAIEYLREVLFADGADSHRLLGVRENSGLELTKEHYRWLIHWLHPDRDASGGSQALAQRVNRAWRQVRGGDAQTPPARERVRHKGRRNVPASTLRTTPPLASARPGAKAAPEPMRRFPTLAIGSALALMVAAGIAWKWFYAGPMMDQGAETRDAESENATDDRAAADATTGTSAANASTSAAVAAIPSPVAESTSNPGPVATIADERPASAASVLTRAGSAGSAAPAAPASSAAADPSGDANARPDYSALPDRFASAYSQGDLARMMELFTDDAVDANGRPGALAGEYERLFRSSSSRRIRLYDWSWNVQNLRAAGNGAYEAWITHHGREGALHLQGRIQIEAVPVAEAWKIRRIALQESSP